MKKIALVAALAAISAAPAFAQSSVTLWGRLNTTVESQKVGNQDRKSVMENNSSRLGLRGTEDLGGGLKAGFNLEHGFDSDTGSQSDWNTNAQGVRTTPRNFWSRQANVELIGSFGTVRLGTWFPDSYFSTVDRVSNHNHDTGTSSDALFSSFAFGFRSNKIGYFSPTMGGFSFIASAHAGEGTAGDARAFDLSGNYEVNGLHIGATYSQADTAAKRKNYTLEADYAFGPFLVAGYYQREEVSGFRSRDIGRVSAMYTTGASEFHVNVGGTKSGGDGTYRFAGGSQWTLGYNYNLSKRTKVYGFYTSIDQKLANKAGDFDSLAVGIRHNF